MHTIFWSENVKGRDHFRTRHRWEDNIRTDLRETGWEGVERIHPAQDRDQWQDLGNTIMNFASIKGDEFLD
jgi:hypothetical protein